ncbi:MAG TPA: hypothetical protein PKZ32_15930 [Candidatus Melainabacteria bacterium]|nr:hypothetical protein [Candidatus Melainabacteria bacterium]
MIATKKLQKLFASGLAIFLLSSSQLAIASSMPNSVHVPGKILQVKIDLRSPTMSPEAVALGDQLGLTPLLSRIQSLRGQMRGRNDNDPDIHQLRLALNEARQEALEIVTQVDLEADYVEAQIVEEQSLYADMLQHMTAERDKSVAITNAVSFGTNGALWAVCEAIAVPTYRQPILSIPSGILGVLAGVIPSFASFYAMRQVAGKKYSYKEEPNMLSKLFDRPVGLHCEYPDSVWNYLAAVPPNDPSGKRRVDQIIDRWIVDNNIPSFTSRSSERQVDLITGTKTIPKTLTIDLLSTRQTMLDQLTSEVLKMKRLLLELMLAVRGTKQI